jgi:CheY-like chemotaxis protein
MKQPGPILIVEDDYDDQDLLRETFQALRVPHELLFFNRCIKAFKHLKTMLIQPFLILCDINLPEMIGTEFRKLIFEDDELRKKSIPFVFFTTSGDTRTIEKAYEYMIQGYFVKPLTTSELKMMMKCIVDYWSMCRHPNDLK